MDYILITLWVIALICIISLHFIDGYLITRLKKDYPSEYERSGSPIPFRNDFKSFTFMFYCLDRDYQSIPDKDLVYWFNVERNLTIGLFFVLISFIMYCFIAFVIFD